MLLPGFSMVVKMYNLTRFEKWRGGVQPRGGICLRDERGEANMVVAKNTTRIIIVHKVPITCRIQAAYG